MKISVCVETVFTDRDIAGRLQAITEHGIKTFELWTLDHDRAALERSIRSGFRLHLFCGNRNCSLIDPADRPGFATEFRESIKAAKALACPFLAVLSDRVDSKGIPIPPAKPLSEKEKRSTYLEGLAQAISWAEQADLDLLIEPLNTRVDHPGYFLQHSREGFDIVRSLGSPRVKLLYDVYHLQIMEGDLIRTMEANLDMIGHIHVADVPGRHELGTGEINYKNIARMLQVNRFGGYVGLECFPSGNDADAIRGFAEIFGE
jgi:hydroxypyruvate isomerase